jgi:hypothetical protein
MLLDRGSITPADPSLDRTHILRVHVHDRQTVQAVHQQHPYIQHRHNHHVSADMDQSDHLVADHYLYNAISNKLTCVAVPLPPTLTEDGNAGAHKTNLGV